VGFLGVCEGPAAAAAAAAGVASFFFAEGAVVGMGLLVGALPGETFLSALGELLRDLDLDLDPDFDLDLDWEFEPESPELEPELELELLLLASRFSLLTLRRFLLSSRRRPPSSSLPFRRVRSRLRFRPPGRSCRLLLRLAARLSALALRLLAASWTLPGDPSPFPCFLWKVRKSRKNWASCLLGSNFLRLWLSQNSRHRMLTVFEERWRPLTSAMSL